MKRNYNTGQDTKIIRLGVRVGTAGTAYTSVYQVRSGGQSSKLLESGPNNGNLKAQKIGSALQLRNSYLVIRTTIDFSNVPAAEIENQQKITQILYGIEGGFSGKQIFNNDTDDVDIAHQGKIMIITKPIELL